MVSLSKCCRALKRIFDVVLSLTLLVVTAPLMAITAIVIKLDSRGPAIFSQERVGLLGRRFIVHKFRSMRVDAERNTGPIWAKENDDRITRVGRFLRQCRIDELPQLWNVLWGEMSVIGPRPERPVFVEKFKEIIPDYEKRISVKPGITGLAQVWHKYDETIEDVKKKVRYDLLYIRKICLWADLRIMLRTVRVVFTGEGAR